MQVILTVFPGSPSILCIYTALQYFAEFCQCFVSACVPVCDRCGLSAIEISLKEDSSTTKRHLVG